jgi:PAS domain S-box-containing protein
MGDVSSTTGLDGLLSGLLEVAPDAMLVVEQGQIRFVNRQAEFMFGYSRQELRGQPIECLIPERFRQVHTGHRRSYESEPKTRPMGAGLQLFACRKDGSEFPAEVSLAPLQTANGLMVSAAIRDVTQQRQAETKFRALLEAAPDAMVIVDQNGKIALVNGQTERLFGYQRSQLLGQPVEILVPRAARGLHESHRQGYQSNPHNRQMGSGRVLYGLRQDGSEFPVEISLSACQMENEFFVASAIRDVSAQRQAEKLLQSSLREKETLLKEVHHRVKNNLQVICSLLNLQSQNLSDPSARAIFSLCQTRIQSIALVHEKLYRSSDLAHVDFADYLRTLTQFLFSNLNARERGIRYEIDGARVRLPVDMAVPLGLIVNELVLNSLKHAFPDGAAGTVKIELKREQNQVQLLVADDGVGFHFEAPHSGLGLELVSSLSAQVEASIAFSGPPGSRYSFEFKGEM